MNPGFQKTLRERFESRYIPEPNSGCWLWDAWYADFPTGARGVMHDDSLRRRYAHQISFELFVGPIPDGALVCHTCDVSLCVNPRHLYAGTSAQNSADMVRRGRSARGARLPHAKLTDDMALAILADTRSQRQIARSVGVCQQTVSALKRGVTWRHVRVPHV